MTVLWRLTAALVLCSAGACARIDARRSYLEGQRFEAAGRWDRAAEAYRSAAREDPSEEHDSAVERAETALFRAHLRAAKKAEEGGDHERAAEYWKQLVRLKPKDERLAARLRIAELRVNGSSEELWEAGRALLDLAPGNREVIRVVGEIQTRVLEDSLAEARVSLRAGDRDRAFTAFERVKALDARHPELERPEVRKVISEALEEKADALASTGDWEGARSAYARAHEVLPRQDIEIKRRQLEEEVQQERKRLGRARSLRAEGRGSEALAEYVRLLPPAEGSPLHSEIEAVRAEVEANRRRSAENMLVRGEVERALAELEQTEGSLAELSFESKKRAVELLLEEARTAGQSGEARRSAGRLKRAMKLAVPPDELGSLLRAGVAALEANEAQTAMSQFARARSLEPRSKLAAVGHEVARELQARSMLEQGRSRTAKDPYGAVLAFQAAAKLEPSRAHAEHALARVRPRAVRELVRRGFVAEAEGLFGHAFILVERALELAPDDVDARAARGRLQLVLEEPNPPAIVLEAMPAQVDEGGCTGVEAAWMGRLQLYLSRARKLPFVLAEDGATGALRLRSRIDRCEVAEDGGKLSVTVEVLADGAPIVQTSVHAEVSPLSKGKLGAGRVSAQRDELVTRAAAQALKALSPHRKQITRWAEVRARQRLEAGQPEPVALAYATLRLRTRGPTPDSVLLAELRTWLLEHLR